MMRSRRAGARILPSLAIGAAFVALILLERRFPLRADVESKLVRTIRNSAIAVLSALVVARLDRPLIMPVARAVERRRWGLLLNVPLPAAWRGALAIVLLDYTMYHWHVLLHRIPGLWRFHLVHHVDLDLDTSTALRFHFGELALSIPWRMAQIAAIGVTPAALTRWQALFFLSILFHHSNIRLPIEVERVLNRLVVTPRMHGIHHSIVPDETNANWSSGLTVWDLLHGTARLNVPQEEIVIGVAAYRDPTDVTLGKIVAQPFGPQRAWAQLPAGDVPQRQLPVATATRLAS